MELLFVYGTLKNPAVTKKVIGRRLSGESDVLEGFSIGRLRIGKRSYPAAILKSQGRITGLVLSVTSGDLEIIDRYETEAYSRKKVKLKSGRSAWVYVKA